MGAALFLRLCAALRGFAGLCAAKEFKELKELKGLKGGTEGSGGQAGKLASEVAAAGKRASDDLRG